MAEKKKPYKKFPPPVLPGRGGKKTYDPDPKKTSPPKKGRR
jgi:hypothetical protein